MIEHVDNDNKKKKIFFASYKEELPKISHCKIGSYDFSGFYNSTSYEYKVVNRDGSSTDYRWNVCAGSTKCNNNKISVCSLSSNYDSVVFGEVNDHVTLKEMGNGLKGGILTYIRKSNLVDNHYHGNNNNNDKCPQGMKSVIKMYCAIDQPTTVVSVQPSTDECTLEISMLGKHACEKVNETKSIIIFVIIAVAVFGVISALVLSVLYIIDKKKKESMRGYSKLPTTMVTPNGDDIPINQSWK